MGKITFCVFFLIYNIISAQSAVEIIWENSISGTIASPTIEVGETVTWSWRDSSPKSVTSLPDSKENFDSGVVTGSNKFSYKFTQPGTNDYQNDANPAMHGTVTVVQKLSTEDKFVKNLSFYPNPVKSDLTIFSIYKVDSYQIFNVLGSMVAEGKGSGNYTQIDMSRLNSGLYFVKVISNSLQATLKIAKK
ncbi:T9SS type A sorting domain-containing protein [Aequorivita echinoideorum]|uniref:T9SS type A sorting domain-containing protein n=1 Tax=Aequorivita echinoideorum TaxID=1549647 RepID=A0ABS5S4J7_9FLAO|nr:T9SS type A sorting domain-containing protein [Aequorivita echinoideorum]MBT0608138.1 T9SS type A sorting domain-containing protein [Aequorivita echinoideorum]